MIYSGMRFAQKLNECKAKSATHDGFTGKLFNETIINFRQTLGSGQVLAKNHLFLANSNDTASLKIHHFFTKPSPPSC